MTEGKPSCAYEKCDRVPHKTSSDGRCIFHAKAQDKNEKEFKKTLKKYIEEGNYDFRSFVFVGDIDFEKDFGVTVFKNVSFEEASFQGRADFGGASFQGGAIFEKTSFQEEANFAVACFQGVAFFWEVSFQEEANFRQTSFQEEAFFWEVSFQEEANFRETSFQGRAIFVKTSFQGGANFGIASFQGVASFSRVSFQGEAYFGGAEFRTRASISLECMKGYVSLLDAILENISLTPLSLDKDTWIDFTDARLRNTEIRREDIEGHVKQEREKDFSEAKEIYLLLKNNFHSLGRYDDESWAFLQEKEMERKSFWSTIKELQVQGLGKKWKNRGLKNCFYPAIFYSGRIAKYLWDSWLPTSWKNTKELAFCITKNFRRPLACVRAEFKNLVSFMTMNEKEKSRRKVDLSWKEIFKALLFYLQSPRYKSARKYFRSTFLKCLYGWGEKPWLIFIWCGITIFIFSGLYCFIGDIATATNATIVNSYPVKLYFSGITFTTLGFGGYSPMGGAKVLAFIESFLGIFSIALFVYSFARRTAGR